MGISNIAVYMLIALATLELGPKVDPSPSSTLSIKEPQISTVVAVPDDTIPESTQEKDATTSRSRSTAAKQAPIAPPETLDTPSHQKSRQQSNPVAAAAVKPPGVPADIFTPQLDQISTSLPPGWVMRLPAQILVSDNLQSQYTVGVFPSSTEPGLTVSLFTCEQPQSCLLGSFVVAANTSVDAQTEFKKHQAAAAPISLANNARGYLLEGPNQSPPSGFSSVMWEQDNQFYTVRFPAQERQNILYMAYSMTQAMPIQSTVALSPASAYPVAVSEVPPQPQPEALTTTTTASPVLEQPPNSLNTANTASVGQATPTPIAQASPDDSVDTESLDTNDLETPSTASVLQSRHPVLTTANQLQQGEVLTNLRVRQSFPAGTSREVGLTGQPTLGVSWGVTDNLELTLDVQTVDNGGPVNQGPFGAQRINPDGTGPNFFQEFTLQAKHRLWENQDGSLALSGVAAASLGNAGRPYRFFEEAGAVANGQNDQIVTSLELPFTVTTGNRLQFTLSPKVAFLPEDNALYFNTPPLPDPGSFGTTFGLAGAVSYQLSPRLLVWGDAFFPLTGNNTINRDTGLPAQFVAFNAGLRYLVNPRLATDLFVSNTLGNTGPLSIVADREYPALGVGVTFLPGITGANRRYAQSYRSTQQPPPATLGGFALLDGGTVRNQQLLTTVQGGEQGLLTGIRYGLLDDLEIGAFLNNIPGTVDESELGFSGKIRFLHQADGDPLTLSGLVTLARSNNVLTNLISNNRNEFEEQGLEKGGFAFSNERNGELFIVTLSTPMHYQFDGGSALWLTPTLGFVQRNGLEIAGFSLGGSVPVLRDLNVIAEAGLEFGGEGNAFIGNDRETVIPWILGLRWNPSSLLGISETNAFSGLQLELYVTNRVGSTPFESLRVRADNDKAIGFGLLLPIQF